MFKGFFYSILLYAKRLKFYSFLYLLALFIIILVLGLSWFFIDKVSLFSEKIKDVIPENRIKIVLRDEGVKKSIMSIFSKDIKKEKNFIKPDLLNKVRSIKGINSVSPIHNIDFPISVYFSIPGSSTVFNAEVVGIGISESEARKFVYRGDFSYKDKEVPVLVASYLIEVFNSIIEANDVPIKLTKESVIGFTFNVAVGSSFFGSDNTLDTVKCRVVGFIDLDYTVGIAFPSSFIAKYKKHYWSNFRDNYYDFLISYIDLNEYNNIEKKLSELGLKVKKNDNIFNKIADIINTIIYILKTTVGIVFLIILFLGILGIIYTIIFMLKGRKTEFFIYNFFGGYLFTSTVFWSYITILNIFAVIFNYFLLGHFIYFFSNFLNSLDLSSFAELSSVIKSLSEYSSDFLLKYSLFSLLFFESLTFLVIYLYNFILMRKET